MKKVFNVLSNYYDLIYEQKDYAGEAAYIVQLIKSYSPKAKNLIEFGTGTGKHAFHFCNSGFTVKGVEPSAEMLKAVKEHHPKLSLQQDSITSFKSDELFDVATALFHVISYLNSNSELIASFKNVHKHLKNDGLFIFDVWYSAAVLTQIPEERIKTVQNDYIEVIRKAKPINYWNRNVIEVAYDINVLEKATGKTHNFLEQHEMRHFSIPEIELLADITGFKLLKAEEFGTAKIPGPDTWGVNFVLRKK
ncbi:MAG: class I SAM-dependent methyltransferase [Pedobacter sp.]|uniref:class I SAM-dependent DNA methyltransferase n=1 Tax=Pedobacter sp. TaxID=1411316 RepID=UPI00356A0211